MADSMDFKTLMYGRHFLLLKCFLERSVDFHSIAFPKTYPDNERL